MKALFLDRDGVINVDHGYVCNEKQLDLIRDTVQLIKIANIKHIPVIVVTNQSGIARGFYSEHQHSLFSSYLKAQLFHLGAYIQDYFYCPYLPNAPVECYSRNISEFRKPNPGLINYAISIYKISPSSSVFIGDNDTDMEAAHSANIAHPLLFSKKRTHPKYHTIASPLDAIPFL